MTQRRIDQLNRITEALRWIAAGEEKAAVAASLGLSLSYIKKISSGINRHPRHHQAEGEAGTHLPRTTIFPEQVEMSASFVVREPQAPPIFP